MSDLLPCPFCGEVPFVMSVGMAGQPRWQHPVNDTCPIAGHYLGGWDFPEQWNRRALPAVQPDAAAIREAALREVLNAIWRADLGEEATAMYNQIVALIDRPAHVNETPKSEHDTANVLTPATKGGDA